MADTTRAKRVVEQLEGLVDGMDTSQLSNATVCGEWDVRALLNHLTGGGTLFATILRDGRCPDELLIELMVEDQLGDQPAQALHDSATAFLDAAASVDEDAIVSTPFGDMPVSVTLDLASTDLTIHTVDLALAIGVELDALDVELLDAALDSAPALYPLEARLPGVMEPPTDIDDDAHPALRLAAFAGRAV